MNLFWGITDQSFLFRASFLEPFKIQDRSSKTFKYWFRVQQGQSSCADVRRSLISLTRQPDPESYPSQWSLRPRNIGLLSRKVTLTSWKNWKLVAFVDMLLVTVSQKNTSWDRWLIISISLAPHFFLLGSLKVNKNAGIDVF